MFEWRDVRLDVETEGRITSGMSVADWTGQSGRARNCRVLLHVDKIGFRKLFLDTIARRDQAQAHRPAKRQRISSPPPLPPPGQCLGPPSCCPKADSSLAAVPHPRVGVGVLLLQEGRPGYVLVGRRKGSHASGWVCLCLCLLSVALASLLLRKRHGWDSVSRVPSGAKLPSRAAVFDLIAEQRLPSHPTGNTGSVQTLSAAWWAPRDARNLGAMRVAGARGRDRHHSQGW